MSNPPRRRARRRDTPPPRTGTSEKDVLVGFLDYLRTSIAEKIDDVPEPAVRTPGVSSGTNLLGLIKHLTNVERYVFLGDVATDWESTFQPSEDDTVAAIRTGYRQAIDDANEQIAACRDLTAPSHHATGTKGAPSMRWALTHMIEETGRHAGHADILRELIDGNTGR